MPYKDSESPAHCVPFLPPGSRFSALLIAGHSCFVICVLVFLTACGDRPDDELPDRVAEHKNVSIIPGDASPAKTIRLQKRWEIGHEGDLLLNDIYAMTTDRHGNVYISTGDQIHLFDPEGNYRETIGQYGSGPGDLVTVFDMQIVDNTLYALDFSQLRIQLFSTESLEPDGIIKLDIHDLPHAENAIPPFPLKFRIGNDRSILIGFQYSDPAALALHFYRFDRDGNLISDQLLSLLLIEVLPVPGTDHFVPSPVGGRGLFQFGPDSRIFTASTKEFFIKAYGTDGRYQSALYHPLEKRELRSRDAMETTSDDRQRKALAASTLPEYWPLLEDMVVDDEKRIWVSVDTGDADIHEWRVVDMDGSLLARFDLPLNRKIKKIRNNYLYALDTDDGTGLETLLKFELIFEPGH